jgi:supervillin
MTAAQRLVERFSFEGCSDMKLLSVSEGYEDQKFWRTLGGKQDYYSLLQEPKFEAFSPRMFLLSRASGKFAAEEILSPSRLPDGTCIFPFLQSDLYDAPQPALFLLDAQHCVYLWCGWWPVKEDGKPAASTGMAADHWVKDKELGMKTATDYAKSIGEECPAYVVVAGCEPCQFTTLFPFWTDTKVATNVDIVRWKHLVCNAFFVY